MTNDEGRPHSRKDFVFRRSFLVGSRSTVRS